jgi:hypothetical protein
MRTNMSVSPNMKAIVNIGTVLCRSSYTVTGLLETCSLNDRGGEARSGILRPMLDLHV